MEAEAVVTSATTRIVVAFVRRQRVEPADLAVLLDRVRSALSSPGDAVATPQQPAVNLRRLVRPDAVHCADCGWSGKSMRRHLAAHHGLSPEAYRAKWGLRPDHPMIAPSYSARRAELARSFGLGARRAVKAPKSRGARSPA